MFQLLRRGDETLDLSPLLAGVTGTAWLTRSGKIRVLRLIDVVPSTLPSGGAPLYFLQLEAGDRPAYRLDDKWPAGGAATRSGFVLPQGPVGVWSPESSDSYRLTITWGVA